MNMPNSWKSYGAIFLIIVSTLVLQGCSRASAPAPLPTSMESISPPMAPAPAVGESQSISSGKGGAQITERLVVKNAELTVVVKDPAKSMDKISSLAETMGGFVVSANMYETQLDSGEKVPRASITIRIPADQLNSALAAIKSESDRLPINEKVSSQDVTAEYTDQQSRLKNLEAAEKQLTSIMEEARRTEDVLSVYNQLVQIREQIEVTKGQIKYYEQSAAMSAISVELVANQAVQPLTIGSWQPVGVAKDAVQALINTLKFLANVLIWIIIYILPVLVVLYLIVVMPIRWFWRRIWRGHQAKKQPPVVPPPDTK